MTPERVLAVPNDPRADGSSSAMSAVLVEGALEASRSQVTCRDAGIVEDEAQGGWLQR